MNVKILLMIGLFQFSVVFANTNDPKEKDELYEVLSNIDNSYYADEDDLADYGVVIVPAEKQTYYFDQDQYEDIERELKERNYQDSASINSTIAGMLEPIAMNSENLLKMGAATTMTLGLMQNDGKIKEFAMQAKNDDTANVSHYLEKLGNTAYTLPASAALYLAGSIIKDPKLKRVAVTLIKCQVVSGVMAQAIKVSVGRQRPNTGDDPYLFGTNAINGKVNRSFPSGHTTTAFTIATVFADSYKDEHPWVPYVSYTLAALTGMSRIHDNRHWASDVAMGALLGIFTAKVNMGGGHAKNSKRSGLMLVPMVKNGGFSLNLMYVW